MQLTQRQAVSVLVLLALKPLSLAPDRKALCLPAVATVCSTGVFLPGFVLRHEVLCQVALAITTLSLPK
jgi:hypothetical protein